MTRIASHTSAFAAVRGVGLIEVLVALLLISIGMLGLGSLQINAKRVALESLQRTKALYFASGILSTLRTSHASLSFYEGGAGDQSTPDAGPPDCFAEFCDPSAMAAYHLARWEAMIKGRTDRNVAAGDATIVDSLFDAVSCTRVMGSDPLRSVDVTIVWSGLTSIDYGDFTGCGGADIRAPQRAVLRSMVLSELL
jgi:type IV pilus assembly protein PilV